VAEVGRWNSEQDGRLSEEALVKKLESMGYSCTTYVYPPGTFFDDHSHAVDKIDAVLKGRFCIGMDEDMITLEAGDWIHVPRGAVHNARVIGNENVVSIDAVKYE
jgi:quercetin dioxygenase-like cupin family protein